MKEEKKNQRNLKIYLNDEIVMAILVDDYDINTYTNSMEITCHIEGIEATYNIPLNKGYRVVADI